MAVKQFHLFGEDASTVKDVAVPDSADYEGLQHLVASHFNIVDPEGVGFVVHGHKVTALPEIISQDVPIAISIDGKAVRDVPGPTGLPYFGSYFEIFPDHLGNRQRLFDTYGPLFLMTAFGRRVYQTNDPKLATIVFDESDFFTKSITPNHPLYPIKSNDAGIFVGDTDTEEWRQAHKFLPPALGPKAVRHYAPIMQKTVEDSFRVFDELDQNEEAWNVYQYMLKLGSQAIGKIVVGTDFKHFDSVDAPNHEIVLLIADGLELTKRVSSIGGWYGKLPFGDPKKLRCSKIRFYKVLEETVARASKGQEDLDLQDAALKAENLVDYCLRATDNEGNKLPPKQVIGSLSVIMTAGFSTTSSLLSWLIYCLVRFPEMQERLLQELVDHDWHDDIQVTTDLANSLPFLHMFIKETERVHSPAAQSARTAKTDMILPGGYKVPKDAIVVPAISHIHKNSKIWDNPTQFDPERWDTDKVRNRPTGSFMPFAAGPRGCIGFNFALQEVKVFLPKLLWRYKFSLAQDDPVEYDPFFISIRPNNVYVRAQKRVKWPPKSE